MAKKYMIVKATKADIDSVTVDGKTMQFGKKTQAFEVNDPGLARAIEQEKGTRYTGDVVVVAHDVDREPGHRYSFAVPELPWKKKKETP